MQNASFLIIYRLINGMIGTVQFLHNLHELLKFISFHFLLVIF